MPKDAAQPAENL